MSRPPHRAALAALAALIALSAAAQDKPAGPPGPGPGAAEVVARLRDGTVVRKALLRDGVVVATRFGKLTVPAAEIRRIEFGRHLPAGAAREVEGLVRQLGSDDYQRREAAGKRLVALGPRAYPALQAASGSPDKEVAAHARAAAEQVRREVPAEELSVPEQDVVYTRDCVLAGRIEGEALQARSASLGELSLRLAELRSLHSAAVDRAEVAVEAAPFGAGAGKWADSGVPPSFPFRLPPPQSSSERNGLPSCSPTSYTCTMLACCSRAIASASVWKRVRSAGPAAPPARIIFSATTRFSLVWRAL
jgi:hypothetical protein